MKCRTGPSDARDGDRAETATLDVAGRVTATSDGASYAYDAAGSRSPATVDGLRTTFAQDAAGRLTGTSTPGRSTAYAYDGLDRRVGSSDADAFGTDAATRAWDGLLPVAGSSSRHGVSSLLRHAAGDALVQSGVSWLLGDARDVTATASSGGVLDDLVSYGDFGGAASATSGWDAAVGYEGQPGDATLGVDEYFARSYDPGVGSWLEADSWRGELGDPQSRIRYSSVKNSRVSYADAFGFMHTRFDGGGGSGRSPAARSEVARAGPHAQPRQRPPLHRGTASDPDPEDVERAIRRPGTQAHRKSATVTIRRTAIAAAHPDRPRSRAMDRGCRGSQRGRAADGE